MSCTGSYEKMADLKKKYSDIKISLAIGGWNYGVGSFSHLVNNKTDVEVFAANVISFLRRINFDGLDLDWEYPGNRGSPSRDKHKFTKYCQVILYVEVNLKKIKNVHANNGKMLIPVYKL